jgi:hypothetical protein
MISNLGAITAVSSHIASGTYDSCGIGGSPFKTDKEYMTIISILSWFVILILGWIPLAPFIFNNFMDSCVTLWVSSMGGLLYPIITFIFVIWIKELVSYNKRKKNMKTNYSAEISRTVKSYETYRNKCHELENKALELLKNTPAWEKIMPYIHCSYIPGDGLSFTIDTFDGEFTMSCTEFFHMFKTNKTEDITVKKISEHSY